MVDVLKSSGVNEPNPGSELTPADKKGVVVPRKSKEKNLSSLYSARGELVCIQVLSTTPRPPDPMGNGGMIVMTATFSFVKQDEKKCRFLSKP